MEAAAGRDVVPTLVLCCAKDTRHLLPPVLELFVARGYQVEVVSVVDERDDAVLFTAQRRRDAVYVLFESAELANATIDRIRGKLVTAGVTPRRIAAMPVDWRGPLDVVTCVERMGVAPPPMVRRPTAVGLPSPVAANHIGTAPTVAPGPPPIRARSGPPPIPAPPRVGQPAALLSGSVPVLDGQGDAEISDVRPSSQRRWLVGSAVALASVVLLGVTVSIVAGDDASSATNQSIAIATPAAAPVSLPFSSSKGATPATATVVDEVPMIEDDVELAPPVMLPDENSEPPPLDSPLVDGPPIPLPPAAVGTPQPTAADDKTPTPELPESESGPKVTTEAPSVGETVEVAEIDQAEMQSIYSGLIGQKFRALDILLIAPEPKKKRGKKVMKTPARMNYAAATAYCESLEIAGVSGWRLPRVGELGSVTEGSLIGDGLYWSQTEGDTFGKTRVVWNTQKSKMGPAPMRWKGGRVVCVRTMARPVEVPVELE